MPIYEIVDPDTGDVFEVSGSRPPTQAEAASLANERRARGIERGPATPLTKPQTAIEPPTRYESPTARAADLARRVLVPNIPVEESIAQIPAATSTVGGVTGGLIGGAAGGIGAVPGSMVGATMGGAGGEALRQLVQNLRGKETQTAPLQRAQDIVTAGSIGGLTEAAGPILQGLGRGVYGLGARMTPALRREFPEAVAQAIKRRFPIGWGGLQRAEETVARGGQEAEDLIAWNQRLGAPPLNVRTDIVKPVIAEVGPEVRAEAKLGYPEGVKKLGERMKEVRKQAAVRRRAAPVVKTFEEVELAAQPGAMPTPIDVPPPGNWRLDPDIPVPTRQELALAAQGAPAEALPPGWSQQRMAVPEHPAGSWRVAGEVPEPSSAYELVQQGTDVSPIGGHPVGSWRVNAPLPPPPRGRAFHDISLKEAQELKKKAQDLAIRAYRAEEKGGSVNATDLLIQRAQAGALKKGLESRVGPKLAALNAEIQKDIGARQMIGDALVRGAGLPAEVTGGALASSAPYLAATGNFPGAAAALASGVVGRTALTPAVLSRAGIGLNEIAPYAGPSLRAALLQLLGQSTPDEEALGNIQIR